MVTWITAAENSTTRGWTGGLSRTLGRDREGSVHRIVVVVVIGGRDYIYMYIY